MPNWPKPSSSPTSKPLSKPYPVLALGSFGEGVLLAQKALNIAPTKLPRLAEDSSYGPKTLGRVKEFQGQKNAVRDGVVGPETWAALEPFVQELQKLIDQNFPAFTDEAAQRQRIVDIAQASFDNWGWGVDGAVTPDGSPRIAAAKGYGVAMGGKRPRQGGVTLAAIYAMASAGGSNCLTISTEMEAIYQQNPTDAQEKADRRKAINQDIGSWCGIFATYCLRASGLSVTWNDVKTQSTKLFDIVLANQAVKKGDIGVYDAQLNHHFVVVQDAGPSEFVHSIDGNVGNPAEATVSPWNSVISKRKYLRNTLITRQGRFLRPKFSEMKK
jgi:peptidoglycan hydrolase-like protein with peptidoglycan-binding domain